MSRFASLSIILVLALSCRTSASALTSGKIPALIKKQLKFKLSNRENQNFSFAKIHSNFVCFPCYKTLLFQLFKRGRFTSERMSYCYCLILALFTTKDGLRDLNNYLVQSDQGLSKPPRQILLGRLQLEQKFGADPHIVKVSISPTFLETNVPKTLNNLLLKINFFVLKMFQLLTIVSIIW